MRNEFSAIKEKKVKLSYAEQAYDAIKELILREEIKPGELLSENQLAEFIGKSRTPVREAIRMLEADGVLEVRKGVGTFLRVLSLKDIKDMYEVRESLELIAAKTAIKRITDDEAKALRANFQKLLETDSGNTVIKEEEFAKLDTKIHELILENSSNQFVKILMEQINFNCQRYRRLSFKVSYNLEESTIQHLQLLDDILNRDLEKFQEDLSKHIQWSFKTLQENLNELY